MVAVRELWQATAADGPSEHELQIFLSAFVRYAKPELVIETGCHVGEMSVHIATSLLKNGRGKLLTCDTDEACVTRSRRLINGVCLPSLPAEVRHSTGKALIDSLPDGSVDIAFIDSWWCDVRIEEGLALKPKMKPFSWVFLHDVTNNYQRAFHEIAARNAWDSLILPYGYGLGMYPIGQGEAKATL